MRDLTCLYCFKSFSSAQIHFRCSNGNPEKCSYEEDKLLSEYRGINTGLQPRIFAPPTNSSPPVDSIGRWVDQISKAFLSDDNLIKFALCDRCRVETRKQVCPHCHNQLPMHFGETESRIIALIGAKESGKSNYISVLINELKTKIAAQFGASFSEVDDQTMERYNRDFRRYTYVERVAITTTRSANADPNVRTPLIYRLDMEKDNLIGSNIQTTYVVFFDTAGEDLVSGENMERVTKYIAKAQGIIFLIDPLQILSLQDLLRQKNIRLPVENTDPQSIMIRTANLIRDEHRMPLNKKIKTPIAFTFSKIDAVLPLMDPSTPVRLDPEHYGFFDLEDFERVNTSMCTYLDKWVGPGFNMFPKLHFENYAYFGLSALGSAPDPDTNEIVKGVVPHRIADPFLWILYQLKLINETRRSQAPLRFF